MPTTLAAHEQPIAKIFSDDYVFNIPGFQRPYAWTTEQAGDLFDDLMAFLNSESGDIKDMSPYFLGSIVLQKMDNVPDSDVVDGQQRLTTLMLLLSAIRANILSSDAVSDLTRLIYQKGSQILDTPDRFRLSLRERDREFFKKYVQQEDGFFALLQQSDDVSDSQRNIRDNARLFDDALKAVSETQRLRLAQFVASRCFLVVVSTPDLDSAYRIFSVLNSRGLDLSPTDILKARIIGDVTSVQRDAYTAKWEDTEEDLGREPFGDLFSHIRMVYRKAKPKGTLIREFTEHVLKGREPIKFIDDILLPMATVYEFITDAAYVSKDRAKEVNESLKWLNRIEFKDWLPPALAFGVRWQNNCELMERFFKDLERLTYAILVTKVGINDRLERFSELTSSIEKKEDLWTSESPLQLTPAEQHETFATLSGPIYQTLSARARSTVLVRLDALISGGGASYDYDTITVEHVLPQNPEAGSEWLNWFPDAGPRANLVHMLGNLALLTRKKNSAASNYSFEKKKTEYFSHGGVSPFPLTTQVLQHKSWSPAVIESRQNELLTKLEQQWRLEQRLEEFEENAVESSGASSGFQFTRRVELEAKRTAVVEGFFNSRGAVASRKSKTNYEDSGKSLRVTCVISKRFSRDDVAYWYALHPNWIEFMKGAHHGYYVLGCMDLKVAYALSFAFVKEHLQEFNKTDKDNRHYWHVALKVANGKVLLNLSKVSKQIDLSPYKFELINSA